MKRTYFLIAALAASSLFAIQAIANEHPTDSMAYALSMDYGGDMPTILLDLSDLDFGMAATLKNETRDASRDRLPVMLPRAPDIHAFRLGLKTPWQYQRQ
ncbi:MAG: hypothetical protein COA78_07055 [Blastopirellula sp.]|nr:MAG: hypothetical protein COA78_07055 [Blastopirellula sp.]